MGSVTKFLTKYVCEERKGIISHERHHIIKPNKSTNGNENLKFVLVFKLAYLIIIISIIKEGSWGEKTYKEVLR